MLIKPIRLKYSYNGLCALYSKFWYIYVIFWAFIYSCYIYIPYTVKKYRKFTVSYDENINIRRRFRQHASIICGPSIVHILLRTGKFSQSTEPDS